MSRKPREQAGCQPAPHKIFAGRGIRSAPGPAFIWLGLPEKWHPAEFASAALGQGIRITPGTAFANSRGAGDHAVRIAFGGPVPRGQLRAALERLNALLDEVPGESFQSVA